MPDCNNITNYKYALSVTSQFYFCGMPFRLDITPKCELDCLYCFAMARGGRKTSNKLLLDYKKFESKIYRILENRDENYDINGEFLRHRHPIHFGGMSDPFSTPQTTKIALKCIELLNKFNYPILLSTKNTNVLKNDYVIDLIKNGNIAVQISFSCFDSSNSRKIEPFVPSPLERIKTIAKLTNENIFVIARLQPLFHIWMNEITNLLVPALGRAGCEHLISEFLKLPVEKYSSQFIRFIKTLNWDVYKEYKKLGAKLIGREWILPNEMIIDFILPLIDVTHNSGMTFSCGDYGLNHISDTKCCCGIDRIPNFDNWFKGNFSNVIKSAQKPIIKLNELDNYWYPSKSITSVINSNCRINSNKMKDYLINKWNRPNTSNSINSYLGLELDKLDDRGNWTYINRKMKYIKII